MYFERLTELFKIKSKRLYILIVIYNRYSIHFFVITEYIYLKRKGISLSEINKKIDSS